MVQKKISIGTKLSEGKYPLIRKVFNRCIFHGKNGLCELELMDRTDCMPKICRLYPRRSISFGDRIEVTMELSCIKAAAIFLSHTEKLTFEAYRGSEKDKSPVLRKGKDKDTMEILWTMENEDPTFLSFLFQSREKLLEGIWNENRELPEVFQSAYIYGSRVQNLILKNRIEEAAKIEFSKEIAIKYAFFPMEFLNDMIYQDLSDPFLIFRNPDFFKLLEHYKKKFGAVLTQDADAFFQQKVEMMETKYPNLPQKYRAYFSYCIQETYCQAYEDYYLLGPLMKAILYTQFLMLFDVSEFLCNKTLDKKQQAYILAAAEHGLRHSLSLNDKILSRIRTDFLPKHLISL